MRLAIHASIEYFLPTPTDVLLQLEAASLPEQTLIAAHIDLPPTQQFARIAGHDTIGDRIWLQVEGSLAIDYTATVEIQRLTADLAGLPAVPPHLLPEPAMQYLLPSRYCPSDEFLNLVTAEFGNTSGGERVMAIRDWIAGQFSYVPGSSNASTGALESYVKRQGVCRDYAHVLITLVRASAIPARFASVYAPDVAPQDFHAVAEVFLDGVWYPVDATGMARPEEMAKIGVGRDAADVSFLTSYGPALFSRQQIEVSRVQDPLQSR